MGATRAGIVGLFALEVLTLCAAGGAIGLVVGVGGLAVLERVVTTELGLPYEGPGVGRMLAIGLLCLVAASATGLLAALAPVLRAAHLEPHVAINDAR
jgi:ABC-type lipoprotein release transport system permease subunit